MFGLSFKKTKTPPSKKIAGLRPFENQGLCIPFHAYESSGERDFIVASSGMGKSYLVGVLVEEELENGGIICIVDIEGEYWTLKERYAQVIVIGGEEAHLPLKENKISEYVASMYEARVSLIFDLSGLKDDEEKQSICALIADEVFKASEKSCRNGVDAERVKLIIDEAQEFAPQSGMQQSGKTARLPDIVLEAMAESMGIDIKELKKHQKLAFEQLNAEGKLKSLSSLSILKRIAKRGRKKGADVLVATQRPASINKDITSQCNRYWFGGIKGILDFKAIETVLDEARVVKTPGQPPEPITFSDLQNLKQGEFYFYSPSGASRIAYKIRTRKRFCKHGAETPSRRKNIRPANFNDKAAVLKKIQLK